MKYQTAAEPAFRTCRYLHIERRRVKTGFIDFFTWLKTKLGGASIPLNPDVDVTEYEQAYMDFSIREMAFWSGVNVIASAIAKCEFKTFLNGKETKGAEYYLWNVEPNKNQNSSDFIRKMISYLYAKNECLIVEQSGKLLIADRFDRKKYALYEDVFSNVTVEDFTFNRTFTQSEVLYFELSQCDMRKVTAALYSSYSRMISYSMDSYQKSRGNRGILNYEAFSPGDETKKAAFNDLMNNRFKTFFSSNNAVLPLPKGYAYDDLTGKTRTYSAEGTRDIRAMIDDICDFTAKALNIPPALIRGDVQGVSDVTDQLLTFCIDPLAYTLAEEINRKRNGYSGFARGTYLQIDTKAIKHIDLLAMAGSVDKLISSGCFCVNDIRRLCDEPIIEEPWAWRHYITKNYTDIADMAALEGG